ncbi:MipA/OmpV family protein [Glaciecola sp. KUL10]|uniref:MipA/OmpV family protein n=1 Tax=Glaciecola sp. (strain KUL10) TaxID=2161813 RepID=UPI000D78B418|nr:MipA/OmpV family protein [Glaciecola sp. KUL10]GBL05900.1 hypothetical protein KUL10_32330 [Glaciecola sp. KUL10]
MLLDSGYLRSLLTPLLVLGFLLLSPSILASDAKPKTPDSKREKVNSSKETDLFEFTLYLRFDAFVKTQLYSDPNQSDIVDYLDLFIGIDAYYGAFFLETSNQANHVSSNSTFGYRIYNESDIQIDVLLGQSYLENISENKGNIYRSKPSSELKGIRDRSGELNQGLRFTKYYQNQAWWVDFAADPFRFSHGGYIVDAYIAQAYQLYNWELQTGLGLTLFSKEVVDYQAGVLEYEATPSRPAYRAGFGHRYSFDLSAQYPLSESWVFVASLSTKHYSDSFAESPIYGSNKQTNFGVGIMYVW